MSDCFRAGVTSQKRIVQVACLLATAAVVAAFYIRTLPLPTWEVTAVRYHEVGLNWRHLSASATLLVNLTVHSSSVFPLWFERTSVDLFFPGPQGERRPLGVGSFGGMFLNCGKNYVEVSPRSNRIHLYHGSVLCLTRKAFYLFCFTQTEIKTRPFGIPGALAVQRTKGRTGQQVVLAMGSTEIRVLGLFPVSMVSECEHSIRVNHTQDHTTFFAFVTYNST